MKDWRELHGTKLGHSSWDAIRPWYLALVQQVLDILHCAGRVCGDVRGEDTKQLLTGRRVIVDIKPCTENVQSVGKGGGVCYCEMILS